MKRGDRIELIKKISSIAEWDEMDSGILGFIHNVENDRINVELDNGKKLGLVIGQDEFKVYPLILLCDYLVHEETTKENVEVNVIESNPKYADLTSSGFVGKLFKDGVIELGAPTPKMNDNILEYFVDVYDGEDHFVINYDIMAHSDEFNETKSVKVSKKLYSL